MLKDASKRRFDVVMAWAIDRLGRSLIDLLTTIQHLEACGVDMFVEQQALDTTTPAGKLMFQVTGAFAEFERSMIRQRVKLGLKRAVANGQKLGRPTIPEDIERKARAQLAKGTGHHQDCQIARNWSRHRSADQRRAVTAARAVGVRTGDLPNNGMETSGRA